MTAHSTSIAVIYNDLINIFFIDMLNKSLTNESIRRALYTLRHFL